MKFNFRKISAIAVSALMTGMTMGVAAAANYPAPFVTGGTADVAIVYGTGTGVSSLDQVQAGNIQESLGTYVDGGTVTVEGGDSFKLEKSSNNFNFYDELDDVYGTLDDEQLTTFLAEGDYDDGDIDTTFTQTITLSAKKLTLFKDTDYNDDEPTVGFTWANGDTVLSQKVEFDDSILFSDLEDTDLPLMGSTYYVLDVDLSTNTTITLLDSAEKVILKDGDSVVVGEKTVTIEFIDSDEVKFNVDGEITNKLNDHEYEELEDGSYIVTNEIMYNEKESGISSVEFSLGKGKIDLLDGDETQLNDEDVDGLETTFGTTGSGATMSLTDLTVTWKSDGDSYLSEEDALTMPLFESVKLVFGGMNFPDESETISLSTGDQMNLEMGNYDLPLFYVLDHISGRSGEEGNPLVTALTTLGANYSAGAGYHYATNNGTGGMNLLEDDRFLITNIGTDLTDIDTWYYEVTSVSYDSPTDLVVELTDLIGDRDITFDALTDVEEKGDLAVTINQVNDTNVYLNFSVASGTISYRSAVSEKGMLITLPANVRNATNDFTAGVVLNFTEPNKDDDVGQGVQFTVTVKNDSDEKLYASSNNLTLWKETTNNDNYIGYVTSDLATKVTSDQSDTPYTLDIEYYGAEVSADVMVVGGTSTVSSGGNVLGDILVTDAEVSTVSGKNLIVVGGSCINSAAAALVGGAKCGAAWTAATGVGAGQFLIKGYATSTLTDKVALLVAGYEAADTVKATTALINTEIDTSKTTTGTTSTGETTVLD